MPDDASALEADRQAWLAEERTRRRRARTRRLLLTRRWDRFGLSGPLVVLCLLLTAAVGSLAVVFVPRPANEAPSAAPLADVPALPAGAAAVSPGAATTAPPARERSDGALLGRRLPETVLRGDVRPVPTRDLRPAVLVLLPDGCTCFEAIRMLYRQARGFRLETWLVGSGSAGDELVRADEEGTAGGARWAVDAPGTLARALAARGLTVAVVAADGVLAALWRDVPADPARTPRLEPELARLSPRS